MNKPSAQRRTLILPKMRMSLAANTVIEAGSSGFALEPPQAKPSKPVAKSTQFPANCRSKFNINSQAAVELARQLGESTRTRKARTFTWAIRELQRGCLIARHAFALEEWPKRLYYRLEGCGEIQRLVLVCEHAEFETGTFVYSDVMGRDWYIVEQLEIAR